MELWIGCSSDDDVVRLHSSNYFVHSGIHSSYHDVLLHAGLDASHDVLRAGLHPAHDQLHVHVHFQQPFAFLLRMVVGSAVFRRRFRLGTR